MMEKQITIERSAHRHEWGLAIRDKLGITLSLASLNAREVAKIIEGINAAAEQGAGWPRYEKQAR